MKEMTLTEQLKAVNLVDEASQLSLLENCSNLHFLTLALLALSQSIRVHMRILHIEELHVVVLKILEMTVNASFKAHVYNHKSYKAKGVDKLDQRDFFKHQLLAIGTGQVYVPECDIKDPLWLSELRMREKDTEWLRGVVYGGSIPHILSMIININLDDEVIKSVIYYLSDYPSSIDGQKTFNDRLLLYKCLARYQHISEDVEAFICGVQGMQFISLTDIMFFFPLKVNENMFKLEAPLACYAKSLLKNETSL